MIKHASQVKRSVAGINGGYGDSIRCPKCHEFQAVYNFSVSARSLITFSLQCGHRTRVAYDASVDVKSNQNINERLDVQRHPYSR